MEEKHAYRLIRDLFTHKEEIFGELKRASSLSHSVSVDKRPSSISTDESNRKANMEARNRAIAAAGGSRSRATSPAPSPRSHRRDRSSGGPETRFPIQTSPTATTNSRDSRGSTGTGASVRQSLEVPGSTLTSPVIDEPAAQPLQPITNGSGEHAEAAPPAPESIVEEPAADVPVKRDSLSRAPAGNRFSVQRRTGGISRNSLGSLGKRDSVNSLSQVDVESRPVGVSLTDKPMDD
jgi:hypothetical protein